MVKYSARLDAAFAALADPTRRAIVARLARGDAPVGDLARPFQISAPAVSKHLRVLERAGLLRQERQGRVRQCRLNPATLRIAAEWIDRYRRFWTDQLDALAAFMETADPEASHETESKPPDRTDSLRSRPIKTRSAGIGTRKGAHPRKASSRKDPT